MHCALDVVIPPKCGHSMINAWIFLACVFQSFLVCWTLLFHFMWLFHECVDISGMSINPSWLLDLAFPLYVAIPRMCGHSVMFLTTVHGCLNSIALPWMWLFHLSVFFLQASLTCHGCWAWFFLFMCVFSLLREHCWHLYYNLSWLLEFVLHFMCIIPFGPPLCGHFFNESTEL